MIFDGQLAMPDGEALGTDEVGDARHALDELFRLAGVYRSTADYANLMNFVAHFHWYAPYNAMLVHVQKPGATFVARADTWMDHYGREIRPGAQPLVMLRPMGPVMFVFDVVDTVATPNATELPPDVTNPFQARGGEIGAEMGRVINNAMRDGVEVADLSEGSQGAGRIRRVMSDRVQHYPTGHKPNQLWHPVKVQYYVELNAHHDQTTQFASLVHELAHLYCGHLGTPDLHWWPDRQLMGMQTEEFEAESVSWLVCRRLGVETPSDAYLSGYYAACEYVPPISLDTILKASGLILEMAKRHMPLHEEQAQRNRDR